jgi:hypothetical protein
VLLHGSLTSRNAPYPRRISCGTREAGAAKFSHPVKNADANLNLCLLTFEAARGVVAGTPAGLLDTPLADDLDIHDAAQIQRFPPPQV